MSPTPFRSTLVVFCLLLALSVAPRCRREAAPSWSAYTPVGKIVAEAPATVRIFELVKIDYCRG